MYIHDEQSIDQPFQNRLVTTEGEDRTYSWYYKTCAVGHIIMSGLQSRLLCNFVNIASSSTDMTINTKCRHHCKNRRPASCLLQLLIARFIAGGACNLTTMSGVDNGPLFGFVLSSRTLLLRSPECWLAACCKSASCSRRQTHSFCAAASC